MYMQIMLDTEMNSDCTSFNELHILRERDLLKEKEREKNP